MNDQLDLKEKFLERAEIKTEAQAVNWLKELERDMLHWREQCNVYFPDDKAKTAIYQKRASWTFLDKHGQVIGAAKAMRLTGVIGDRAYKEVHQRALNALAPTVVGQMQI